MFAQVHYSSPKSISHQYKSDRKAAKTSAMVMVTVSSEDTDFPDITVAVRRALSETFHEATKRLAKPAFSLLMSA